MSISTTQSVTGNIVDVVHRRIFPGCIHYADGRIQSIEELPGQQFSTWLTPGFVDAHVHVESSLLPPTEFARAAVIHGSVASVSDPHEIANVMGVAGIEWMLDDAARTPFKVFFGAPSCVPATSFETAGASLGPDEIDTLLGRKDIHYLAEVMNFPAVLNKDPRMSAILQAAARHGKPIDGHAPGLIGDAIQQYAAAGVQTDHECSTAEEGRQRIANGMKLAIREGSAARNFAALLPVLLEHPDHCFFCSDDKHPDDLVVSNIDALVARAVSHGLHPIQALRVASFNPIRHYGLAVGLLQPGDSADFIELDSLQTFKVLRTWIDGQLVAEQGKSLLPRQQVVPVNNWTARTLTAADFSLSAASPASRHVIVALDGEILTDRCTYDQPTEAATVAADPATDTLKLAVINRYQPAPVAVALVRGFGLKNSALASSVAHDSHNLVVVGSDDELMAKAANAVMASQGGLAAASADQLLTLDLPIAGLMSCDDAWTVADKFTQLTRFAQRDGCSLRSPFMALSFMPLLVIPKLKLSDLGLFDVEAFALVE